MNDSAAFSPPSPSASPSSLFHEQEACPLSAPHVLALGLSPLFLSSSSWMPSKDSDCHTLCQATASRRGLPYPNTGTAPTVPCI